MNNYNEPLRKPESALPWYPVPPYRGTGMWQAVDSNGELVAKFEERKDCEFACHAVNMLAEWHRNDEEDTEVNDD